MCREICHFVGKKAQKGQQVHFKAVKKLRKRSGFVIYSWYFKDNAFTVVERDAKFYTWCVKGVSFVNRGYTKGETFLSKTVCKRVRGRTSGWSVLVYHFGGIPRDVVNSWRSPKNARLRGRPDVFPVVAFASQSDHRKVTRDDRKYVCVQSLVQMKPLPLWPSFFGEFLPLKTLPKEIFVFLNF